MNKGIRLSHGEIVGIINSDDWYELNAVERMMDTYRKKHFDMFYADLRIVRENGRGGFTEMMIKHSRLRAPAVSRDWNHPTTFITRKVYDRYQYKLESLHDDWDLVLKIRRGGYRIVVLNEVLANKDNPQFLKLLYGTQVNSFQLEVLTETARKEIIENFFAGREGEILTEEKKKDYIEQLKTLGLSNEKYEKDFSFPYIMKLCRQYSVCDFKEIKANKKDIEDNKNLVYRKKYMKIVPI